MTRHTAAPWQELPADEAVTWTPASPPQAVEGPLALELFRDRLLALELAPDQVALHVVDGRIRRAYLDGHHHLPIGQAPEGWLVFLRPDVPIAWRWQDDAVLHVDQHTRLPLRGACAVHVSDPVRFHDAVLAGLDDLPLSRLAAVLDTLVRGQLESRLRAVGGREGLDPLRAKVILEGLEPAALDDDLDALGLSCGYLAAAVPVASENDAPTPDQARPACYDDVF